MEFEASLGLFSHTAKEENLLCYIPNLIKHKRVVNTF